MELELRPATVDDLELILAWRSHPAVYEHFYQQDGPLKWESHVEWWRSREHRRDWIISVYNGEQWRDVGSVNASNLDSDWPEVGIFIGEINYWGKGVGSEALHEVLDWLATEGYDVVSARILDANEQSQRLFESVGFEQVGDAREGESEYRLSLTER